MHDDIKGMYYQRRSESIWRPGQGMKFSPPPPSVWLKHRNMQWRHYSQFLEGARFDEGGGWRSEFLRYQSLLSYKRFHAPCVLASTGVQRICSLDEARLALLAPPPPRWRPWQLAPRAPLATPLYITNTACTIVRPPKIFMAPRLAPHYESGRTASAHMP